MKENLPQLTARAEECARKETTDANWRPGLDER